MKMDTLSRLVEMETTDARGTVGGTLLIPEAMELLTVNCVGLKCPAVQDAATVTVRWLVTDAMERTLSMDQFAVNAVKLFPTVVGVQV